MVRSRLILLALTAGLVATLTAASRQEGASAPGATRAQGVAPVPAVAQRSGLAPRWLQPDDPVQYAGSDACEKCHEQAYADWKRFLHIRMTKEVGATPLLGDFSPGTKVSQHGRRYAMEARDGRYFISVAHGDRPAEQFEVSYTLGAKRVQGYLTRLPDGRIYVLPVFWHEGWKRWIDWREITPVPDTDQDLRQIWNITCFNCHATSLAKNFDIATRRYSTSWSEMGIGCEGCHGPGAAHVRLTRAWESDPASKPVYDNGKDNRELSRILKIFSARSADRRQVFDTCAYCHGNKNNLFVGFVPGDRYEDFALPFLPSQPPPADDPQGDFWPDGRPSRFNRNQALMLSGCFIKGDLACTSCHVAHGSRHPHALKVALERSDLLCTQCHQDFAPGGSRAMPVPSGGGEPKAAAVDAHTRHPAASAGARCVNCHMSDVNWRLLIRRRDHTFKPPVPEMTARLGVPNACTECHEDRTPEWAAARMDEWYGDGERRAREMRVAETMSAAALGDVSALRGLASIVVDRGHGATLRASAAELIGRLARQAAGAAPVTARGGESQTSFVDAAGAPRRRPGAPSDLAATAPAAPPAPAAAPGAGTAVTPAVVNALIGAASDPEATVRAVAVGALGQIADPRAVTALSARLVDPARTVRIAAAEALLALGFASLPGAAGAALARAQDEYAASLATFGDAVGDHVSLGWLELQRGRDPEARTALANALTLDQANPQARVFLGVIEARGGRFDEALREWRRVKREYPGYPNIDRLIAEADKRRGASPRR